MDLASVGSRASLAASSLISGLTSRVTLLEGITSKVERGFQSPKSAGTTVALAQQVSTALTRSQVTAWSDSKSSSNPTDKKNSSTDEGIGRYRHIPLQQESSSSYSTNGSATRTEVASKAQDILRAYRFFCTIDVEVSGRIEGRSLIRLLTDIDGHPKEDPVLCFTVVVPEIDCGLRFEEHEDGRGGTFVAVDTIEDQSPAMYIKQLTTGLRLVDLQGVRVCSIKDLTNASKSILAAQRRSWDVNKTVAFRFQEPAYLVDRYNNALELEVLVPPSGRKRKQLQKAKQLSIMNAGTDDAAAYQKRLLQIVLPEGAYTTRQDFVSMLQAKLGAAVTKADLPGRWEVRLVDGDIAIRSTKCPFRILFKSGEWSQRSVHTLLGFDHEDTKESQEHKGQRPRVRGMDVGYLTRKQMEQLGVAIMMRYDASCDGYMNFEEFYSFYIEFLLTPERMRKLKAWIKDQFLSEEELRQKEADAKEAVERERRKEEIDKSRYRNHEIRSRQRIEIKKRLITDQDGQTRMKHKDERPPSPTRKRKLKAEGEDAGKKRVIAEPVDEYTLNLRATKRQLARSLKQTQAARPTILMTQLMTQAMQQKTERLDLIAKKDKTILHLAQEYGLDVVSPEKPVVMHPAFFGYLTIRSKPFDPTVISPIFFNHRVMPANKSSTNKMSGMKQIRSDVVKGPKHYSTDAWKFFPYPRTNTVIIRQTMRSHLPRLYDEGQIIHPACFGNVIVRERPLDSTAMHPSLVGFKLERKPQSDPHSHKLLHLLVKDKVNKVACDTCLISKPGCPTCWEMPVGFVPSDFELTGPTSLAGAGASTTTNVSSSGNNGGPVPAIHTKLTTERAISWHRKLSCDYITVCVKSLPYGAITTLQVEKNDTVSYLYHLFLANCPYGDKDGSLYIPHSRGCFSVDRTFLPASDLANEVDTGREPLCNYNLKTKNTRVLLLHVQTRHLEHSLGTMAEYIRLTLNRDLPPDYKVIYEINDIPPRWDDDPVQCGLLNIMDEQLTNTKRYQELKAKYFRPKVSKKGTVAEGESDKAARLTKLRHHRRHEVKKILGLQQIVITEGVTTEMQVQRPANAEGTHAVKEKMQRQRFRKHRRDSFQKMQEEWKPPSSVEPNFFITMGATRGGLASDSFYADLN